MSTFPDLEKDPRETFLGSCNGWNPYDDLPEDYYGALVKCDKDARRLCFLARKIEGEKLRRLAAKYSEKEKKRIGLRRLFGQCGVAVPGNVHPPPTIHNWRVYIGVHCTGFIKVGMSSNWIKRINSFMPHQRWDKLLLETNLGLLWDLDRSLSVSFRGDKKRALTVEKGIKDHVKAERPKRGVRPEEKYGFAGRTEWFYKAAYQDAVTYLEEHASEDAGDWITLRAALEEWRFREMLESLIGSE